MEERELPDRSPSLRYRFVHVLYQNALYATLRATRRTQLHARVAAALEAVWATRSAEVAQELAMLWEGAREPVRASDYFLLAARQAFEVHADRESAALAARGLALLEALPESRDRDRRELALQVAAGAALRLTQGYGGTEVGKAYRRAVTLSERARDDSHMVVILRGLWEFHELKAEYGVALNFAKELFTFADRRRDRSLLLMAHDVLGDTNLWMGELRTARRHLERGLELYDRERLESDANLYGYDSGMACLSFLSLTLWYLGFPDQARRLGIDPPHQVIVACESVRVLDRQLCFAHPAHAIQRLHYRPVPRQQRFPHLNQQPIASGESRVAGRDVPHPRPAARPPRPGLTRPAQAPRKPRLAVRPPRPSDSLQ